MISQGRRLRAVPTLIVANVVIYLLTAHLMNSPRFLGVYALTAAGLESGRWEQLITHAFLHGGIVHLLFNMMGLWFAGRIVERVLGTGRFLALYFAGAAAGGLLQVFVHPAAPLVGASGAVFAVLTAFATLFPAAQIVALFFFIPVRLRAGTFGLGLAASSLVLLVTGVLPGIGHAAHFGGCLAGYVFARILGPRVLPSDRAPFLSATVHPRYPAETDHRNFHGNPG